MASMREALREAVRRLAYRTSLESLRKRGIDKVSIVGLDRIVRLVEESVHRSLRKRLVGLEREAVADAAKSEFIRLLRSNEDLERSRGELEQLKERAEDEVDRLRRELEAERRALAVRLQPGDPSRRGREEGEDARLAQQVGELFAALAQEPDLQLGRVQEKVLELLMALVGAERQAADEVRHELQDREVTNLQRRIGKLMSSLEQTEARLREVTALSSVEQGISSVYRQVQGLQAGTTHFARKKELMTEIFRANLKLQGRSET